MNRVAELIYIVPEERDEFIDQVLHRSKYVEEFMYSHGMRNQYYFKMGDYFIMTFSYHGHQFNRDMEAITTDPEVSSRFVPTRRKDVAPEDLMKVSWWAPLKKMGAILTVETVEDKSYKGENMNPSSYDEDVYRYYWGDK